MASSKTGQVTAANTLDVEKVRRILAGAEYDATKEIVDRAESALEDFRNLLVHAPVLHNGKLSTGTIDYAAFRIETLSLIFEIARRTFRKFAKNSDHAYEQFLSDLGEEVGLSFARDLMNRLTRHDLLLSFQDMEKILKLWASFENDTGAGETEIVQCSPEAIIVRLKKNPLRRVESSPHAHCGFYKSYVGSLINTIYKNRARHVSSRVQGANVKAQTVITVTEQTTGAHDECVFSIPCRAEKLGRTFGLLNEAYNDFFGTKPDGDFSACMIHARGALVAAQMEAIGFGDERAPRGIHLVYKESLSKDIYVLMDNAYQRVSSALHAESGSRKIDKKYAWDLLFDIRKCVYALELLELDEAGKEARRTQAKRYENITTIEDLAAKAADLDQREKRELKELLSKIKGGAMLPEEGQKTLVAVIAKIGERAWEIAKPVLSEVLTATVKKEFNLD